MSTAMNTYALGFILGLLLVVDVVTVWLLLQRIAAHDRRLEELEALQDDWEPPEPDFMSAAGNPPYGKWYAPLSVLETIDTRHHAEQVSAEQEEDRD